MPKPQLPAPVGDSPTANVQPTLAAIAAGTVPTHQLVDALCERQRDLLAAMRDVEELKAAVIARGPGKHSGNGEGHNVTVVAGSEGSAGKVFYLLDDKAAKAIDELSAASRKLEPMVRDLAGDEFGNLFDRHVIFAPCEGFPILVPKLLTPAKSRDLLALCEFTGKPTSARSGYILFPEPLKLPKA